MVDVNAVDKDGNTALHYPYLPFLFAEQKMRLILKHGADPRLKDNDGLSPYYDYLGGGEPETSIYMALFIEGLHGINGKTKDKNGSTALGYALTWADYSGDIQLARQLVAEGADVRIPEYDGFSLDIHNPLEAAAVLVINRDEFISLLWEQEEDIVTVLTQQGGHLLNLADKWGNGVVVDTLLNYGVNSDAKNYKKGGHTPISVAAKSGTPRGINFAPTWF